MKKVATVISPHVKNLLEAIRRALVPLNIHTAFKPMRTLRDDLVLKKDPVPLMIRTGVVHCTSCSACPALYVEQTGRIVHDRIKEHKYALRTGDENASTLAEYCILLIGMVWITTWTCYNIVS